MRNLSRALLFLGLAIVAAVAVWAQVYPVRWDDVAQETATRTPLTSGIQAEALRLGPFAAAPECGTTTTGWMTVFATLPWTGQSHFLCICAELFDGTGESTGFAWVAVSQEPGDLCEVGLSDPTP